MRPILFTVLVLTAAAAPLAAAADPGGRGGRKGWRDHHREGRHQYVDDRRDHRRYVREKWRGRPEWNGYGGARAGYWYAPGYGYRPASRMVVWRRGAYLPPPYRVYYVQEPVFYGLAPAPRGHRWVYGDDSFVLIALGSGLITSVVSMSDSPPAPRYEEWRVREERYEEPAVIARSEDVWRGSDGQHHCRRPNGTTGLVIGGAVGALVGREVDGGRDRTAGTVVGAAGGALLGREIERGNARCQ